MTLSPQQKQMIADSARQFHDTPSKLYLTVEAVIVLGIFMVMAAYLMWGK